MSWRYLAAAVQAVQRAGAIQKSRYGQAHQIEHKGEIDIVTEVDRACEDTILEILRASFPDHDIVTEESHIARRGSPWVWFVDPLDGTTNYAHGYPFFCSSVALTFEGHVVAGAIYDPIKDELFTAERGGGARLNGRRLQASSTPDLLNSLLVTGFPYDVHHNLENRLRHFVRLMGKAQAVRRDGAAALDLAYVAAGRIDGFWEERLKPWDVMAGMLMVEEAGGRATRFDGTPVNVTTDEIVAAGLPLHARLVDELTLGEVTIAP